MGGSCSGDDSSELDPVPVPSEEDSSDAVCLWARSLSVRALINGEIDGSDVKIPGSGSCEVSTVRVGGVVDGPAYPG